MRIVLIAMSCCCVAPQQASAQPAEGFQVLDMVVTEAILREMCDVLVLSDAQRAFVKAKWEAYLAETKVLDEKGRERQLNAGLREV